MGENHLAHYTITTPSEGQSSYHAELLSLLYLLHTRSCEARTRRKFHFSFVFTVPGTTFPVPVPVPTSPQTVPFIATRNQPRANRHTSLDHPSSKAPVPSTIFGTCPPPRRPYTRAPHSLPRSTSQPWPQSTECKKKAVGTMARRRRPSYKGNAASPAITRHHARATNITRLS